MTDYVTTTLEDGVRIITLNRPDKKNALNNDMYGVIADTLEAAETDPAVRVILIQGEGDAFTAGNDLMDFAAFATGQGPAERHVFRMLKALARLEVPLVAAVQGAAVGVGTTMLLHCDLVFVAEDAKLSTPFVGLALVPEAASSLLLPARVGHAKAFSMFALGEVVSGSEAARIGLANALVPAAELRARALDAARKLAKAPPQAVRATKRLMRDAAAISNVMDVEGALFAAQLVSAEAREAFTAFMERRPPDFTRAA